MNEACIRIIDSFLKTNTLPPVVLCIGTSKVSGDALGPTVGTLLRDCYRLPAFVYGTLSRPVTALNLRSAASFIASRHKGSPLIAVDCALGSAEEVGSVRASLGPIRAGAGVGKTLPAVGDLSVTAVVATKSEAHLLGLVPVSEVVSLSVRTASAIARGFSHSGQLYNTVQG